MGVKSHIGSLLSETRFIIDFPFLKKKPQMK
jgi:hypothetical protein